VARTVHDLVRERFGTSGFPTVNPSVSTVAASAGQLVRQNPNRLGLLVMNLSLNNVYVGFWPDVSATKGIRLAANGGFYKTVWFEDFEMPGWEWFAIADAGPSAVVTVEILSTGD